MGSIVQKGLRLCSGQTHVKRYLEPLTKLIQEKKVDTTFMITHRSNDLADGPDLYQTFKTKKDGCAQSGVPSRVIASQRNPASYPNASPVRATGGSDDQSLLGCSAIASSAASGLATSITL